MGALVCHRADFGWCICHVRNPAGIERRAELQGLGESNPDGEVTLYTSDGDPDTVTVPDPLPSTLQNEFDPDAITASGKQLIRYNERTGEPK